MALVGYYCLLVWLWQFVQQLDFGCCFIQQTILVVSIFELWRCFWMLWSFVDIICLCCFDLFFFYTFITHGSSSESCFFFPPEGIASFFFFHAPFDGKQKKKHGQLLFDPLSAVASV